jgi:hypothetical protein
MLNPDGVARGHYRQDNHGDNLNRFYEDPSPLKQPTIYAAKMAVCTYSFMPCEDNLKAHYTDSTTKLEPSRDGVAFYLDMHAHATKRGCFIYGNSLPALSDQVENQLYAQLLAVNSAHFEYESCNFSKKHMERVDANDGMSAEGSGRVAMHVATGLVHSYTLECNYNTGKVLNHVPAAQNANGRASPERVPTTPPKYTPKDWAEVGRGVLASILDLYNLNPWSRTGNSKYRQVDKVRHAVFSEIRNQKEYQKQSLESRRGSYNRSQSAPEPGRYGSLNDKAVMIQNSCKKIEEVMSRNGGRTSSSGVASAWSRAPTRFKETPVSNSLKSSKTAQPESSSDIISTKPRKAAQQNQSVTRTTQLTTSSTASSSSKVTTKQVEKLPPQPLRQQLKGKNDTKGNTGRRASGRDVQPPPAISSASSSSQNNSSKGTAPRLFEKKVRQQPDQTASSSQTSRRRHSQLTQLSRLKKIALTGVAATRDNGDDEGGGGGQDCLRVANPILRKRNSTNNPPPTHAQFTTRTPPHHSCDDIDYTKTEALRLAAYARAQQLKKITNMNENGVSGESVPSPPQSKVASLPQVARQ